MKSLLDALDEGRLIELPDNHKTRALEYLAALIEAIPGVEVKDGITESVMAREQIHNTGIGDGWACPHARAYHDGALVCSVGWSPSGIDYGAPDGVPVHLMVMYFVPEAQKNAYLKEISSLAKAIRSQPALRDLKSLTELDEVRHAVLDAISTAMESKAPEAKARMIQLEVKHAASAAMSGELPGDLTRSLTFVSIVSIPGSKPIVLCQDHDIVQQLESADQLAATLLLNGRAEHQGIHVVLRSSSSYQPDRAVHECLAFRASKPAPAAT